MRRSRIYYCAATGCKVNSRTHPLERLFRFPRSSHNLARYLKWVEFAKNPRLRKDKPVEAYMCARHFTRNQFRTEYQMTLIYQAVPSIPAEECSEESFSAKCKFKAPYLDDDVDPLTACSSSDRFATDRMSTDGEEEDECYLDPGAEMKMETEECDDNEDEVEDTKCIFVSGGMTLDEGLVEDEYDGIGAAAAHVSDHSYSTRALLDSSWPADGGTDADHNYYTNTKQEVTTSSSSSPPPPHSPPPPEVCTPQVLLSELVPEEHPWFKITLPALGADQRPPPDDAEVTTSSIREDDYEEYEGEAAAAEEEEEDPLALPVHEEEVSTEDREAEASEAEAKQQPPPPPPPPPLPPPPPDPAKIEMSTVRYRAFVQREKYLSKTLKKKDRALRRLAQRYREKCAKVKELTGSNAELTKLVEALSNSVSVCCDLLGIHDVVFKT